jgi:fermentation-respiration switch protein FrsA (DUF1100 family)
MATREPIRHRLLRALSAAALACVMLAVVLSALENSLIYFPTRGGRVTATGQDVWLRADDGVKLHAFYSDPPGAEVTLLYLHGNAGNVADRSFIVEFFSELPARVLALDYRGYGLSEGEPSETGLYADARAAYAWLAARTPAERLVVLGESLGGGPACELAATQPVGGLVLLSAFTSIPDMAKVAFPWLPLRYLARTRFDNLAKIARIAAPKLIVHGRRDEVVPFAMGERLLRAARPPVQHVWLERGLHNDTYIVEARPLAAALRGFIARLTGPQ